MSFARLLLVIRMRLRALFQRERLDAELDEELQDHLLRQIDAHVRSGMHPSEARRELPLDRMLDFNPCQWRSYRRILVIRSAIAFAARFNCRLVMRWISPLYPCSATSSIRSE